MGSQEKQQTDKILNKLMSQSSHDILDVNKVSFLIHAALLHITSLTVAEVKNVTTWLGLHLSQAVSMYNVKAEKRRKHEKEKGASSSNSGKMKPKKKSFKKSATKKSSKKSALKKH